MFSLGPLELIIIMIVALVIVGPEKLPELARMIARAMRDLKRYAEDIRGEFERDLLTEDVKRDVEVFTQDRPDDYPYGEVSNTSDEETYPYEDEELPEGYSEETGEGADEEETAEEEIEGPTEAGEPSDEDYPSD